MATRLDERPEQDSNIKRRYDSGMGSYQQNQTGTKQQQLADAENKYGRSMSERKNPGISGPDTDSLSNQEAAREAEKNPGIYQQGFTNNTTPASSRKARKKRIYQMLNKSGGRKLVLSGSGVSIAGLLIWLFMTFTGLKAEMFIQNIMREAGKVPGYALEQKLEYMVTRFLATRVLLMANGSTLSDDELLFCKSASISCSLFKTYTTKYIEDKFDLKLVKISDGVEVQITPAGQQRLGGNARSWTYTTTVLDLDIDGSDITNVTNEIRRNSEIKRYIKATVDEKMQNRNVMLRFLAKKVLMRKYGIRTFSGSERREDLANRWGDWKTGKKSQLIMNTAGRVSDRAGLYIACLTANPSVCAESLRRLDPASTDLDALKKAYDDAPPGSEEKEEAKKRYERALKLNQTAEKVLSEANRETLQAHLEANGTDPRISKYIGRTLATKIIPAAGIVTGLDLIFSSAEALDNGALTEIRKDIQEQSYVPMAYGEGEGIVVNTEKMKASGLDAASGVENDFDIDTYGYSIEGLLKDVERSPLAVAENGMSLSSVNSVSAAGETGFSTVCETSDGIKVVVLPLGELVCPGMRIIQTADAFMDNPAFEAVVAVAPAWNNTLGVLVGFFNQSIEALMGLIPGLTELMAKITGPPMEWLFSNIFDGPLLGYDIEIPMNNYVALSGGIRTGYMEMMSNGVDEDGSALGGGGQWLPEEELAKISDYYEEKEREEAASRPVMARLFDINVRGSLAQQVAFALPTTTTSAMRSFFSIPSLVGNFASSPSSYAATHYASNMKLNPFHMAPYGYTKTADIEKPSEEITEETCADSATAREDSLEYVEEVGVSVYLETDPCALEKMGVGILLKDAGVNDDKYSLQEPGYEEDGGSSGGTTDAAGWTVDEINSDSDHIKCADGTRAIDMSKLGSDASAYRAGKPIKVQLCAMDGYPSSSEESNPGSRHYIDGADPDLNDGKYGSTLVSSIVSARVLGMLQAMEKDLGTMQYPVAQSSFRTMSHQVQLFNDICGGRKCDAVATPGYSNHQTGYAIDFNMGSGNSNGISGCVNVGGVCTPPGDKTVYNWLVKNASTYCYKQYVKEYWHWDADASKDCT